MAIAVSLEENGLKSSGIVIMRFKSVPDSGRARTYITSDGHCGSDKRNRAGYQKSGYRPHSYSLADSFWKAPQYGKLGLGAY